MATTAEMETRARYRAKRQADKDSAARAMLAALKAMREALTEHRLRDVKKRWSLCLADAAASKAIAAAESAGIKSEG